MSIVQDFENGPKLEISSHEFWQRIEAEYCNAVRGQARHLRWRRLAMTHLYFGCQWTCEMIASAWGVNRSNVSRQIACCKRQLREKYQFHQETEHDPE